MTDVLTLSDLRLPGGTSHSNAEEIQAQHRLGLSSELVHLNGGLSAAARSLNPRLEHLIREGQASFQPTPAPRRAPLAIVRHPAMIATAHEQLGRVDVDQVIMVVNATPVDWLGREHWRPEEVHEITQDVFGVEPLWSPIGPNAREAIIDRVPTDRLRSEDWVNIIDVDHWWVDRSSRPRDRRPVVGRHSRASVQKWPEQPDRDLIYPPDGRWDIRVLGWDPVVEDALGAPPSSWTVHRFGSVEPRDFLAELDFFSYFHHRDLVEAFGRTVLEAIASGLPAILPPHFEPLFGAAALYAEPAGVADIIEALWADHEAYQAHIALAGTLVRHRFGYEAHGRRLAELLPTGRVQPLAPDAHDASSTPNASDPGAGATDGSAHPVIVIDLDRTPLASGSTEAAGSGTVGPLVDHDRVVSAALSTDPALVQRVPWGDVVPTARDCSLSERQWEAMMAARAARFVAAHPHADIVVQGDRTAAILAPILAERRDVHWPPPVPTARGEEVR